MKFLELECVSQFVNNFCFRDYEENDDKDDLQALRNVSKNLVFALSGQVVLRLICVCYFLFSKG